MNRANCLEGLKRIPLGAIKIPKNREQITDRDRERGERGGERGERGERGEKGEVVARGE